MIGLQADLARVAAAPHIQCKPVRGTRRTIVRLLAVVALAATCAGAHAADCTAPAAGSPESASVGQQPRPGTDRSPR